ncbi:MAG: TGS domain-containing protein [Eubacterium sp.]|nr:TGS domain-containing protein [Eubacterium sp.]
MKINLITMPKGDVEIRDIRQGISIENLCYEIKSLPYQILAAKVNNRLVDLNYTIDEPSTIELLDMRTQAANMIYQASVSLIYVKAACDILGKSATVSIRNSLNKGLYTQIKFGGELTQEIVKKIEQRMTEIVEADLAFKKEIITREKAIEYLRGDGRTERARLIESAPQITQVFFYELDGYRDFFYSLMVPSSGYIKNFELRKYRNGVLLRFPHPSNPAEIPEYIDETKLYQAFAEQTSWERLLGVSYVADLNEKIEADEFKSLVQLSEALHEKKIAQIADMINQQQKRIILIAGPSSSGKTTFAQRLCIQLQVNGLKPLYLGTDDYFVNREDTPLDEYGEKDYENLNALDIELFNKNMNDLLSGKTVDLPSFDFMSGKKIFGKRFVSIEANQPIVIEGIHGLNESLTKFIPKEEKFKIYISPLAQINVDVHNRVPTTSERMLRRIVRDNLFRGHSAKSTIATWPKVRAGEDKNIFPYSSEADVLFNSYHVYEISVLRKYAQPLLEAITQEDEEYAEAQRLLQFMQFFRIIENDEIIVNNSIIREFIGGSVFVS